MNRGRVAFVVLGCAKNQVEAESMTSRLAREGWHLTADIANANLVVVHSCGFLDAARAEATETLRNVRRAAPQAFVVLTGCFAQFLGQRSFPGVDAVLGTGQFDRLPEVLRSRSSISPGRCAGPYHDSKTPRPLRPGQLSAYLRIAEGCDHRCTFCLIPQLRGPLRSRPLEDILTEARDLVNRGVKELVLISQDTTAYGTDLSGTSLSILLQRLAACKDLHWIRLLYAYPSEVNRDLISLLADEPKLCRYLDMPLQHMSDRILRAMRREGSARETRGLLDRLRRQVPNLALRTTFIVGFPGETEEDFEEILGAIADEYFEHVGVFPYSFETRSPSARLPGLVPPEIVQQRWQRVLDAHRAVKKKRDDSRRGTEMCVLVEQEATGNWSARAPHQAPEVDGGVRLTPLPRESGIFSCRITGTEGIHLKGNLLGEFRASRPSRKKNREILV